MRKKYYQKSTNTVFGTIVLLLFLIGIIVQYIIPILLIGGIGYGIYHMTIRKSSLERKNIKLRLQDLKDTVQQTDRQVKLLNSYLDDKDYPHYTSLAKQILPKLEQINHESNALKESMDLQIYKRIQVKTENLTTDIKNQLEKLDITIPTATTSQVETDILKQAPEIAQAYQNIQRDHLEILEKLETATNKAELLAIHELNMSRFRDILEGYLQIKEAPKNYYNAELRLEQAKQAIEQFDLDLDETLKKLNETQMGDFDISLRMMASEHKEIDLTKDTNTY